MDDLARLVFNQAPDPYESPDNTRPKFAFNPNQLPTFQLQPQQPQGGMLGNAVTAGYYDLLNSYGNAASALGAGMGNVPAADSAAAYAREQAQAGDQYKDQALETAPWNPGGSWWNLPRQIPYQIAKQIPNVAATLAGGLAGAGTGAAAGTAIAGPPGAAVGSVVGGALGAFGATYPQSVGSIYGEALDKNGGQANPEAAKEAALYGVPHALLDTASAGLGASMFGKAAVKAGEMTVKQAAKTVLADTAKEALMEGATEGAQRVIELTQRPDMTPGQKANSFIENAFFGAMAGGGMGGVASGAGHAANQIMRATRQIDPATLAADPNAIKEATAAAAPTQGDQQRAAEARQAQEQQMAAQQAQAVQQARAPEPQIEGEVTTAPQREFYTPSRPLQGESDEYLTQSLDLFTRQGDEGRAEIVRQEMAARANDAQAVADQREQIRQEDFAAKNDEARREMLSQAGLTEAKDRRGLSLFDYTDDTKLADQVGEELKKEKPSESVKKLATYLGLLDEQGKPNDVSARMATALDALERAPNEESRYKITKDLEKLSRQFDLQQRMAEREKPAEVPTDVRGSILDAAQRYVEENRLSKKGGEQFINNVGKALDNGVEPVRDGLAKEAFKFVREQLAAQEKPAEATATAAPTGFTTSKGSQYVLHEDGTTTRDKAARSDPGHEGDFGVKPRSTKTVYVTPDQVRALAAPQGNWAYVDHGDGTISLATWQDGDSRFGISPSQRNIKYSDKPAVGLHPVELWRPQNGPEGMTFYQGVHRGNAITEIKNGQSTNAASGGNDVGYGRNEGRTPGPAVQGQGSAAVRQEGQGQVGSAQRQGSAAQGQPVREGGQQGVWTSGGKTESVQISPEVRKLGNGKEVRKVTTAQGKTYYVPAESVSVGGPTASSVSALLDPTSPSPPPAVDTSAPGDRPSAPGTRRESVAPETSATPRSVAEMPRKVVETLKGVTDSLTVDRLRRLTRQGVLYVASTDHIREEWGGDMVPEVDEYVVGKKLHESIRMRGAASQMPVFSEFDRLSVSQQKALIDVLNAEAEDQILPMKSSWFDSHGHIIESSELTGEQKSQLKSKWQKMRREQVRALNSAEAKRVYDAFHNLNEATMHEWNAVALLKLLGSMEGNKESLPEPHIDFQMKDDIGDTPESLRDFWADEKNKAIAAAQRYRDQLSKIYEAAERPDAERNAAKKHRDILTEKIKEIAAMEARANQVPYSHLGRFGNEIVVFRFPTIESEGREVVDPDKVRKVAKAFADTDLKIRVNPDSMQKYAYMRFESEDDRNAAAALVQRLISQGLIEKEGFQAGPRDSVYEMSVMSPAERASFEAMLADVKEDNEAFKGMEDEAVTAAREQLERKLRDLIIDSLPDSSVRKVMVSRKRVTGAEANMIRSAAHRFEVNNVAIASMIANPKVLRALRGIRQKAKEAGEKESPVGLTNDDPTFFRQLYHELTMRHLQAGQMAPGNNVTEVIKALTFTGAMGANVSTALLQGLSVATLGLPRLGSRPGVGMVRAARALTKAMVPSFRILAASLSDAVFTDPKKIGDVVITPAILKKAGFNPEARDAKFIMRVVNSGIIEMGTLARDLGAIVADRRSKAISNANTMLRWANAMNQYMEVASRLTMAFASLDVHNEKHGDLYEFTKSNITNSLFDFSNDNQGRLFNRAANPIARLSTQFMSYPAMWTQLLYREFAKSFWRDTDAETKAEARDFLKMHFAMMWALAGVSGLPFAGALGVALNSMFGSDDEPFDAENEVRRYFTLWFGKDAADVAMRGLPRVFGADVSGRVGGQDLMPFSQFLADQRNWKDSAQALIGRGFGAPASVFLNMLGGLDKIHGGDVWNGMKDLLPRGLHNMMDAVELAEGGPYRDPKGKAIPGTPGALAPVTKAVGFKSGVEADWAEKRRVNDSYEKQLQKVTGPIISGFVRAAMDGDKANLEYYIAKAQEFAQKHPEAEIGKQMMSALKGERKSSAMEQATNLPRAVNKKDPRLMDSLSWGFGQ